MGHDDNCDADEKDKTMKNGTDVNKFKKPSDFTKLLVGPGSGSGSGSTSK
jgi:hypothetical protein